MLQKFVRALVLIPLAILIIAFAVANRTSVRIAFDPFDTTNPAFSVALPLYVLILLLIMAGVVVGGVAAWLRQRKWRASARAAESRTRELEAENAELKRRDGSERTAPIRAEPAPRLSIAPPAA